ncbi:MAG TPA: hypothetical protein VGH33_13410 [Isosphaeraceae bacterium]|jgi:hypothetical protein
MMPCIDYNLIGLGILTGLAHLAILAVALGYAARSFWRLRTPVGEADGLRPALIAIGLSLTVLGWSVLFFVPGRFPEASRHHWSPFVPLAAAAPAATLWALRGRRSSGTVRMMAVVAAIAATLSGGVSVQRWDFRRGNLHQARLEEERAAMFRASARASERCEDHVRRGERCDRCKNASAGAYAYYAKGAREAANDADGCAEAWRRRAEE